MSELENLRGGGMKLPLQSIEKTDVTTIGSRNHSSTLKVTFPDGFEASEIQSVLDAFETIFSIAFTKDSKGEENSNVL